MKCRDCPFYSRRIGGYGEEYPYCNHSSFAEKKFVDTKRPHEDGSVPQWCPERGNEKIETITYIFPK